jgi:MFS family permease
MAADHAVPAASPWSPLRRPWFRALWIAMLVSNTGTWMQDVGAGWLMTSLAPTPVMVALVQAATALPTFFLAIPSGALADIADRRRYLIGVQLWMMAMALALGVLTLAGMTTAWMLLALTFALGIGTAMMIPAWAAIVPELVPRPELQSAVALNAMGMNVSRAIGPAVAGAVIAAMGPGAVFLLNAASFVAVIVALARWPREPRGSALAAERLLGAIRAGLRYARHSPPLQRVLARGVAFYAFASANWALLPLIVRQELGRGAETYGLLVALIGAGAVGGAFLLPGIRARLSRDRVVAGATVLFGLVTLVLAWSRELWVLGAAMLAMGAAWIGVMSSLMMAAQLALPDWVRARGLALFWTFFMGGMAGGSALWGHVAESVGMPLALSMAAAGLLPGVFLARRLSVGRHDALDLAPSLHWPTPVLAEEPEQDQGPVMVTVEYRIDPARAAEFMRAMHRLRRIRLRDGAFFWELFADAEDPARLSECFLVESWLEHLRQHERVTVADREVQERVRGFHLGGEPPRVRHFVAPRRGPANP